MRPDFLIYDAEGWLIASVEAKSLAGTDADWAVQTRRNLLGGRPAPARFFLLVTVDRIYLWDKELPGGQPVEIDAGPLFAERYRQTGTSPKTIFPQTFELFVLFWLQSLFWDKRTKEQPEAKALRPLIEAASSPSEVEVKWAA